MPALLCGAKRSFQYISDCDLICVRKLKA
jgi:hypothetical protein